MHWNTRIDEFKSYCFVGDYPTFFVKTQCIARSVTELKLDRNVIPKVLYVEFDCF